MITLPAQLALCGRPAQWAWLTPESPAAGHLPVGVIMDHGDHTVLVPWAPIPGVVAEVHLTLDSLVPLTIVEHIKCGICGVEGRLEGDRWIEEACPCG